MKRFVCGRASWIIGVVAVVAAVVSPAAGQADQAAQMRSLQEQVEQLRAEVDRLRVGTGENWLDTRRVEQIKTLVREVLSDADTRASLGEGMTAGHNGKKFFLASEDGGFLMNLEGQVQVRYIANFRPDPGDAGDDGGEAGFQLRRTKLKFSGHIADPRLKYVVQIELNRDNQAVFGDAITIGYELTDDLYLWVGEDNGPFLREELISSKRQLAVERSLVNEVFTIDTMQGIGVKWDASESVKFQGMFSDGARSGDSGGDDRVLEDIEPVPGQPGYTDDPVAPGKDFNGDAADFAVTGRVDYLLTGAWKQMKDFTSFPGEELFSVVGLAVHYERDETGDTTPNDALLMWTVDGSVEVNGLNLYAAFVMAHTDFEGGARNDFNPWGLVVQGGYNIPLAGSSIEPFLRYEHIDMDQVRLNATAPEEDEFDLITAGVNWYNHKHAAKLTADVVVALDSLQGGAGGLDGLSDSLGLLSDGDDGGQVAVRLQYQLLF